MRATGARRFGRCVPARCTGAGQAVHTGAHRQADQQRLHERRAAPAEGRGRPAVERAGRSTQPASCLRVRASAERLAAAAPGGRIPWAVDASTASCQPRTPARPCPEFSAVGNLWCAAWLACRYRRRCGLPGAKRRTIGALPVEFERRTALMWTRAGNTGAESASLPQLARRLGAPSHPLDPRAALRRVSGRRPVQMWHWQRRKEAPPRIGHGRLGYANLKMLQMPRSRSRAVTPEFSST